MREISGHVCGFRFVVDKLGLDYESNMWPCLRFQICS
jgi:hypothetical protein